MANPNEQVTNRHSEAFAGGAMAIGFALANFSQFKYWLASTGSTGPVSPVDFKLAKDVLEALYQVEQVAGIDGEGLPRQPGQVPWDHPDAKKPTGPGEHSRDCDCGECP